MQFYLRTNSSLTACYIEDNTSNIVKKNKDLAGLREEQRVSDAEVGAARAQQAKTRAAVMQKEKNVEKT